MNKKFDVEEYEKQAAAAFEALIAKTEAQYPVFVKTDDRLFVSLDPVTQFSLSKIDCKNLMNAMKENDMI